MTTYIDTERRVIDGRNTYWTTEIGSDGLSCRIRLANLDDTTAGERINYDSKCAACYFGHAHSGDYHRQCIAIATPYLA